MRTIDQAIDEAVALDDDQLYLRIGAVAKQLEDDPQGSIGRLQGVDLVVQGALTKESFVDLVPIGKQFLEHVGAQARELLCGSGDNYKDEREAIWDAVGDGASMVAKAIAAFLIGTGIGVPAGILVFVCSLFAKMLVKSGAATLCDAWTVA